MYWRPVTATERTGGGGIPMISTVPFRRTGRAAPFGPGGDQASPGPSHAGGPRCLSSAA